MSLFIRKRSGLLLVITAALLLEFISGAQYYQTRHLMAKELEKRAESELTLKAIIIKSTLNSTEDIMKSHIWDIQQNLSLPDSMFSIVRRMVAMNRYVQGGSVSFAPNYYPTKGLLFEPYAQKTDTGVITKQIGVTTHDYRESDFYKKVISTGESQWVDPYYDNEGAKDTVISYVMPVHDTSSKLAGVTCIDMALDWLSDTLNYRHIYPSSFDLLLTEDGKIIAHPAESRISLSTSEYITQLINDSTVERRQSRSGRTKTISFKRDGRKGVVYYANMKGEPHWQIAVVCYDDEVYESLNKLRLHMALLMFLAFGILLYMVWRFMRSEKQLSKKTLEQQRIGNELRIANSIQQALLPTDEMSHMNEDDINIQGALIPAKDVGGDLYNAFVRDGKLFFCIGDVSGKGIPSALIMAITQTLFRNIASRENNPAHIMTQLNEMACRNNKENIFVTLFVGVLDLPTGNLRFCNAGHEMPLVVEEGEDDDNHIKCHFLDVIANLPIGLFDDFHYEMQSINMKRGSTLFLYTDGLTEARDPQNHLFGRNRIKQMISDLGSTDPKRMVEFTTEQLSHYANGTEQSDDLTILAFRYLPIVGTVLLDEQLTLQNDVSQVTSLNAFVKEVAERLSINTSLSRQLRLAVEEAVVNVMEYAYPAGTKGNINVRATANHHLLKFIITDKGVSFNPTEASTADTTLTAEERPIGGLGILLVRQLMDSINYERIDGKNVLTLSKEYVSEDNKAITDLKQHPSK